MFFRKLFHPSTTETFFLLLTTTALLWSPPSLAQKQSHKALSLLETDYVSSISNLEKSGVVSKTYTLSDFLSSVVVKSGLSTSKPSDSDQKLPGFKSGFTCDSVEGNEDEVTFASWEPIGVATWQDSILGSLDVGIKTVDKNVKGTMIVNWKDTTTDMTENGGVRVTFVVNGTESQGKYVHVLLVGEVEETKDGKLNFDKINATAAGGIAWYGSWLYVGDANKGLRAFDLNHIWKVDSDSAFGMEYILPQARSYNVKNFPATYRSFTFDFFSLDRSEPTVPELLIGEYGESGYTYMAKWPLNPTTGQLQTNSTTNISSATWAYRINVMRVRGMVRAHGKYFIGRLFAPEGSQIGLKDERGEVYHWAPGNGGLDPIGRLPRGVGGLAYSPDKDRIWAVTLSEGNRGVVGIRAGVYLDIPDDEDTDESENQDSPTSSTSSTTTPTPTPTPTATPIPTSDTSTEDDDDEDTSSDQPETKNNTPTILGGVLGSLAGVGIVLWLILVCLRRRRQEFEAHNLSSQDPNPAYPPPGFMHGTDDGFYHKGEIPMLKSELDASSTQLQHVNSFNSQNYNHQGQVSQQQQYLLGGGATQSGYSSAAQSRERVDEAWEAKKAASAALAKGIPQRKPVPGSRGKTTDGIGEGPWVELPAVERHVETA